MNKKGMQTQTLVKIITFVLVLGITFIIWMALSGAFKTESNKQAVNTWVLARGVEQKMDINPLPGTEIISETPPVNDISPPIEIEREEDLLWSGGKPPKLYKEIADSMADCWGPFDRGKTDIMNAVAKDTFCFPCRSIVFSDEIKAKGIPIVRFNKYLNDTKTISTGNETYLQYLANDPNFILEDYNEAEDIIPTDKNLHIVYFAASGRGIVNILSNLLAGDDIVPEDHGQGLYRPTDVTQPQAEYAGISGSEKAQVAGLATAGLVAGRYQLPRMASALSGGAAATTTTTSTAAAAARTSTTTSGVIIREATMEVAQDGTKKITMRVAASSTTTSTAAAAATKTTVKKATTKAVEKAVAKKLATRVGARLIAGPVGWGLTIGTAAYGLYQITFGEKPFVAKVMIVDPERVGPICNG